MSSTLTKLAGVSAVFTAFNNIHAVSGSGDESSDNNVCPGLFAGTPLENEDLTIPDVDTYNDALKTLDISSVFDDIYDLLLDSQECWPADIFGHEESYAGLFLRLAWHCSGTFREGDGLGGCAGGRIRYQPESSWDDNANLDKARSILAPIKETYGDALRYVYICLSLLYMD